jgi:predicted DNA-binding ArsR family transcriptional regulator
MTDIEKILYAKAMPEHAIKEAAKEIEAYMRKEREEIVKEIIRDINAFRNNILKEIPRDSLANRVITREIILLESATYNRLQQKGSEDGK